MQHLILLKHYALCHPTSSGSWWDGGPLKGFKQDSKCHYVPPKSTILSRIPERMFRICGRAQYNGLRMPNRVGPQVEKSSNLHITADSTGSIHKNARGKKFDPKKVRLGCGDFIWKFGIWAFSANFVLFFLVAKNLIHIDITFNIYSYLKSTRKELSDGTLMLKKEYHFARWNCEW